MGKYQFPCSLNSFIVCLRAQSTVRHQLSVLHIAARVRSWQLIRNHVSLVFPTFEQLTQGQFSLSPAVVDTAAVFLFQVLALLLLSIPQALSNKAELEVPLWSPVFSLLFYLMFLVLFALHVIVCTSAESSCYFCGLSWLTAGGVMVLISALLCAVVSALAKMFADGKFLSKVRLVPTHTALAFWLGHFLLFQLIFRSSDTG